MAKVKVDLTEVKQFLIARGERVGLITAGVVMGLFLILGLWEALSAKSPVKDIRAAAQDLQNKTRKMNDPGTPPPPSAPVWFSLLHPRWFATRPWEWIESATDSKRRNPEVLPVGELVPGKDPNAPPQIQGVVAVIERDPVHGYLMQPDTKKVKVFTKNAPPRKTEGGGPMPGGIPPGGSAPPAGGSAPLPQYGAPGAAGGGAQEPVYNVKPARMIVVYGVFPYGQQLELFRKALRKNSIAELFQSKLAPKLRGLIVVRYEVLGTDKDGRPKYGPPQDLYTLDPRRGTAVINGTTFPKTLELFRSSPYDQESTDLLLKGGYLKDGLATPLPELAAGHYVVPLKDLPGIKIEQKTDVAQGPIMPGMPYGKMPYGTGMPGKGVGSKPGGLPGVNPPGAGGLPGLPGTGAKPGEGPTPESDFVDYKKLPAPLDKQFARRFGVKVLRVFDPVGVPAAQSQMTGSFPGMPQPGTQPPPSTSTPEKKKNEDDDDEDTAAGPTPAGQGSMPSSGFFGAAGQPPTDSTTGGPDKVLVRFFDADVKPGKTYIYAIRVRILNPNFGHPDKVAYRKLAEEKELNAPWTFTPPTTVPPEWDFYVVDQARLDGKKSGWKPRVHELERGQPLVGPGQVAVQIQKWMKNVFDRNEISQPLGDWEVLERLRLFRGDPVSRPNAPGMVPIWHSDADAFKVEPIVPTKKGGRSSGGLDYSPTSGRPPVVVDFTGGYDLYSRVAGKETVSDSSSVDLLLLGPDGKLFLRSGRVDSDPNTARGALRQRHFIHWANRVIALLAQARGIPNPNEKGKKKEP
jgi:hypothetical protein